MIILKSGRFIVEISVTKNRRLIDLNGVVLLWRISVSSIQMNGTVAEACQHSWHVCFSTFLYSPLNNNSGESFLRTLDLWINWQLGITISHVNRACPTLWHCPISADSIRLEENTLKTRGTVNPICQFIHSSEITEEWQNAEL